MTDPADTTGTTIPDAGNTQVPETSGPDGTAAPTVPVAPETKGDATAEGQVPESYTFTMPDGVELDKAAADEFSVIAKEFKLSQEGAQKIADIGAAMVQRQAQEHAKTVEGWVQAAKADKDIGGDKFSENLGVAKAAIDKFGSPELKALLDSTGIGNHPAVVKFAFAVGKAISEDGFVPGAPKVAVAVDKAKVMFPTMN